MDFEKAISLIGTVTSAARQLNDDDLRSALVKSKPQ
jgi:hypothetical protein